MTNQTVYASDGESRPTLPLTLTADHDISGDTVTVGLGTYWEPPTVWAAPDIISRPTPQSATVQIEIGAATPPGDWYVWARVTDSPSVPFFRGPSVTVS